LGGASVNDDLPECLPRAILEFLLDDLQGADEQAAVLTALVLVQGVYVQLLGERGHPLLGLRAAAGLLPRGQISIMVLDFSPGDRP